MNEYDEDKARVQEAFQKLKPTCVALLGKSLLSPTSTSIVLSLLSTLNQTLLSLLSTPQVLTPSLISYAFFPLSSILRRNTSAAIPDQVLEQVLRCMALLWEEWWWVCDPEEGEWSQCWILGGSVLLDLGDGKEGKGKGRARDDETKDAAVTLLLALLRPWADEEARSGTTASDRLSKFRTLAQGKHLSLLGQTLSSLLETDLSPHAPLQIHSLELLNILITSYFDTSHVPSFLPGVVSSCSKVALGRERAAHQRGEVVNLALELLAQTMVKGIGDEVCRSAGLIRSVSSLDDLLDLATPASANATSTPKPEEKAQPHKHFTVPRSQAWYRATSSQLLMALNSLNPLLKHPSPQAQEGLATLHALLLRACSESLPDIVPLMIAILLSLSLSPYPDISDRAKHALIESLSTSNPAVSHLLRITTTSLSSLPRYLPSGLDSQIQTAAQQITAAAQLALEPDLSHLADGVAQLLGPNGGIEKWGLSLLHSLHFVLPPVALYTNASKLLESSPTELPQFPAFELKNVTSHQTLRALEDLFRSFGRAGGQEGLYAAEWFVTVGKRRTAVGVAALWVAGRLLEGIANVKLGVEGGRETPGKTLSKFCRWLARNVAELWDNDDDGDEEDVPPATTDEDSLLPIERVSGINQIQTLLDLRNDTRGSGAQSSRSSRQSLIPIHASFSLHMLALSSQVLTSNYRSLFLQVLYPVLHSLVSPIPAVSATAMCTLQVISHSTSYASPANLLLSNFDYALDAVSHRLTRTRLDLQATSVLVVLVRVVGKDVVDKAGDVIEQCFDRLDEFHGYSVLVEGLMSVLGEVISVLEPDEPPPTKKGASRPEEEEVSDFASFVHWYGHRDDPPAPEEPEDFGPTPQEPWTSPDKEDEKPPEDEEIPPTPSQALGKQIVAKSLYFLTHGSPLIRARVLHVLTSATPLLRESDLLPSVHSAWPFILNRLEDPEPFVLLEAATLVCALVARAGEFMSTRVSDDVWPRFRKLLLRLAAADGQTAMARRRQGALVADPYSTAYKLYCAVLATLTQAVRSARLKEQDTWEMAMLCRRLLTRETQGELQAAGRELFGALRERNADAVWLLLVGTVGEDLLPDEQVHLPGFLREPSWEIEDNARLVLGM
ncbi:hypothetical protein DACRYDRAFT_88412 [Dacryopinax primogenitus]|uniref:ARM repeat-containing protein n=1 Tax=Dacryopinax primogenitus (strain DJM 731) TaxID=1858805 RepID=M5FXA6_DACPD|nr:uncharacterized protein DACRYDRAFT_88412 [Dacryopinax primogenitus]EJU02616.1 hypothetical protein DACRYDRAFT_88412 [Dacryopinax primogenitus]